MTLTATTPSAPPAPPASPRVHPLTLGERWEDFIVHAMPACPPEWREELQRFYYAGALEMLMAVQELREGGVGDRDAVRILDGYSGEAVTLILDERGKR